MQNHRHARSSPAAGFTLIEIMVVVTILGLLATLVVTNVIDRADEARVTKAQTDVATIRDAVRMFRQGEGRLPSLAELTTADERGHVAIEALTLDPWGNDYVVREGKPPHSFEVVSAGPDGSLDTDDDIRCWRGAER
ncbi:MAG: type II secretion system protein GspG [Planctomycetes bacterium]|nr:type II secretion system protein GspG [Planctomycetota bacterium]